MSVSATNSTYPSLYNQFAGSIGPVPVTNSTNAGGPPPPPPPPLGQNNQNPPVNQAQPNSPASSGNLLNKTV